MAIKRVKAGGEDDGNEGPLLDPVRIKRALQALDKEPFPFAFGENRDGDPVLVVLKRGKPKAIADRLKKEGGIAKPTWGMASGGGGTLSLDVEGRALPGMRKGVARYCKDNNIPSVKKVRLLENGREVAEEKPGAGEPATPPEAPPAPDPAAEKKVLDCKSALAKVSDLIRKSLPAESEGDGTDPSKLAAACAKYVEIAALLRSRIDGLGEDGRKKYGKLYEQVETYAGQVAELGARCKSSGTPASGGGQGPGGAAKPAGAGGGLSGSVGNGGRNKASDVQRVQELLNQNGATLEVDGQCGPKTIKAILAFQKGKLGGYADGRVDPGGPTWAALNGQPYSPPKAPPGGGGGGGYGKAPQGGGQGGAWQKGGGKPAVPLGEVQPGDPDWPGGGYEPGGPGREIPLGEVQPDSPGAAYAGGGSGAKRGKGLEPAWTEDPIPQFGNPTIIPPKGGAEAELGGYKARFDEKGFHVKGESSSEKYGPLEIKENAVEFEAGMWGEEGEQRVGWKGSVAAKKAELGGAIQDGDKKIYGKLEVGAGTAGFDVNAGEDGVSLGATANAGEVSGTLGVEDPTSDTDASVKVGLSKGVGMGGRLHWGDKDKDGNREYGAGFDYGPLSVDVKTEDPLAAVVPLGAGALYDGNMTKDAIAAAESAGEAVADAASQIADALPDIPSPPSLDDVKNLF